MKLALILATLIAFVFPTQAKPLKVFILAGQSNMEGPANIKTFDYIGDDPATAPMLKEMVGPDGKPIVCDHAWLSYLTGADKNYEVTGKLTAGYGSMWGLDPRKPGDKIGPEFTFGIYMSKEVNEPFLIIKTAWGGKSLHTDFRPPSAGPQPLHDYIKARIKERGGDIEKAQQDEDKRLGVFYRYMIDHVRKVLGDLKLVVPEYDPTQGYEFAGFVWLQAWNDWCDGWWYPPVWGDKRFDEYGRLMAMFIRDVRKDLSAPKMPFVIGVAGFDGLKAGKDMQAFRKAMAAPTLLPEFKGNVVAVQTAPFWSDELGAIANKHESVNQMRWFLDSKHKDHANADGKMTEEQKREFVKKFEAKLITPAETAIWKRGASNAGYHYLGCAKTFALMGKAFAEANLAMMKQQ
jgi:alpha-galactosidase